MIKTQNSVLGVAIALSFFSVVLQSGELLICRWNGCNATYIIQLDFYNHVNEHVKRSMRGESGFCCKWQECQKGFTRKNSLQKHVRLHTGERPFRCDICGKGFAVKVGLTKHIRMHTGESPFKCNICGRGLTQKSALISHMRTHTGEKPYKCGVCGKKFASKASLVSHNKRVASCASKDQKEPLIEAATPTSSDLFAASFDSEFETRLLMATLLADYQGYSFFLDDTFSESYPGEFSSTDLELDFPVEESINDDYFPNLFL